MKSTGNTIFIPGATSGIGLGLALRLHAAGNTVIVAGRRRELLESIAAEHPGIVGVELDTTDAVAIASTAASVIERWPAINVLIPMAGIMHPEDLHSADFLATAEATVTTNLLGPIRLIAAFVEHLTTQPDAAIMTVSSGLAFVPLPLTPTYDATKSAIHAFTEAARVQLADTGIHLLELVPPAVQTALMGQQNSPQAMPLEAFLDEVMAIIEGQPDASEILVESVGALRFATANGTYDAVLGMLSSH